MSEATWPHQSLKARHRDNFRCQWCGIHELESLEDRSQKLHVHHKDGRDDSLDNLITVCAPCHQRIEGLDFENRLREFGGERKIEELNAARRKSGYDPVELYCNRNDIE